MIIDVNTPEVEKYRIHDCTGRIIPFVQKYNTETREITVNLPMEAKPEFQIPPIMVVPGKEEGTVFPVTVTFLLEGSYASKEGQKIEETSEAK